MSSYFCLASRQKSFSPSADSEGPLHPGRPMAGSAAEERVPPGLKLKPQRAGVRREEGRAAERPELAGLDAEGVRRAGRVGELERDLAGLGLERALLEAGLAGGRGGERDRAGGRAVLAARVRERRLGGGRLRLLVVPAATG